MYILHLSMWCQTLPLTLILTLTLTLTLTLIGEQVYRLEKIRQVLDSLLQEATGGDLDNLDYCALHELTQPQA